MVKGMRASEEVAFHEVHSAHAIELMEGAGGNVCTSRLGSSRAAWSTGGRNRTPPGAFQLCNRCVLVEPPRGQLAIRQTDPHHIFTGLLVTLPPIPTRLCREGCGRVQAGMSRCVVWHWMLDGANVVALLPIDVSKPAWAIKAMSALPAVPRKASSESPQEIPPATAFHAEACTR